MVGPFAEQRYSVPQEILGQVGHGHKQNTAYSSDHYTDEIIIKFTPFVMYTNVEITAKFMRW